MFLSAWLLVKGTARSAAAVCAALGAGAEVCQEDQAAALAWRTRWRLVVLVDRRGQLMPAARREMATLGQQVHAAGEGFESFTSGIRLSIARLRELNELTGTVCCYLYTMLPTWRVISLDGAMFVSAFGETHEGHTSPMYRLTGSPHGALHRGFRRFAEELRRPGRQVVGGDGGG